MAIFYQHPYELNEEPRVKRVYEEMWFTGTGILDFIYRKLRQGNGVFPLETIMAKARTKRQRMQMQRVLNDFDLFVVEAGMVSLRPGLNASDFIRRENIRKKVERVNDLKSRDCSQDIFPEEARQSYDEAAERLNNEVREQNRKQIIEFM